MQYATIAVLAVGMIVAFTKLATRKGDPFTNQVAQLATMAGSMSRTEPLLMITGPGPEPRIDTPTATFYSNRRAELVEMPAEANEIAGFLKGSKSMDAIIQNDFFGYVSQRYEVRRIAQNDTAAYVAISPKNSVSP